MMKLKYSVKLISSVIAVALLLSLTASVIITTQDDSKVASEGTCPSGCECMSDATAEAQGWNLCDGQLTECLLSSGAVAAPEYGHCYEPPEEPEEPAECPSECICLSEEAGEASSYELCNGVETECVMPTGATGKCYEVTCPEGCACVTEAVATTEGYQGLCNDTQTLCGYDDSGIPKYCYTEPAEPAEPAFAKEDAFLSQIHLPSGEIRFTANTSYPVGKIEMMIGGIEVKECSGGYCEYTGGPYTSQEVPAFSAVFYDEYNNPLTMADYLPEEITTTIEDFPQLGDFEPCPYCPEPEEGWGECQGHTCDGNDHFQAYDWISNVQLTGCLYENYALTGGIPIHLGEGLMVEIQITEPFFDYCINDDDIVLHRCRNNFISQYTYTCPYGCYNGMCVCATSDGGIDFFERGGVLYGTEYYIPGAVDYCIDEKTLREYYTEIDYENNTCTIKFVDYECPGECRDGACHGTCYDGIQNEGELGVDCGGPCFNACEYDIGWYAQNYGFKFANPAGQKLSYGSCWSSSRHCSTGYGNYKDTFGNCEVCICNPVFRCCSGWHVHAGLYYLIYRYAGASTGQCTGMSLSSLAFYYGDKDVQEYDPLANEIIHLDYTGMLKNNIAGRQGKVVSGENIDHYLFHSGYWGANNVLNKVENALDNNPPDYGMIFMIEDNGWGGWHDTVRQTSWAHTVVATYVEQISSDVTRIYIYDPNVPVVENPTADSPYVNVNNSPYIDINTQSNSYTYIDDPNDPTLDSEGEWISDSNDELFDRIGYMPYSKLGGDVDIPWEWDLLLIGILGALGSADAQVEDGDGATLGFNEDGSSNATIEDGMILPAYGDPGAEFPTVFALPMGDYNVNIRGLDSGKYNVYIVGGSSDSFSILNAGVNANTRDTISLNYGTGGTAALSFSTNDAQKQFSIEIATADEDGDNANDTLYKVMNTSISSGSKAIFSTDHAAKSLLYTNYGNTPVTYSVQILNVAYSLEDAGTSLKADGVEVYTSGLSLGSLGAMSTLTKNEDDEEYPASMDEEIQTSPVYTFTLNPMETHIISPDDWSNLAEAEIDVKVEECGDGVCGDGENYISCPGDCPSGSADGFCDGIIDGISDPDCTIGTDPDCKESSMPLGWPAIGGIIAALVVIAIIVTLLLRGRGDSTQRK